MVVKKKKKKIILRKKAKHDRQKGQSVKGKKTGRGAVNAGRGPVARQQSINQEDKCRGLKAIRDGEYIVYADVHMLQPKKVKDKKHICNFNLVVSDQQR